MDTQTNHSFVDPRVVELLAVCGPSGLKQIRGNAAGVTYTVSGQTAFETKCDGMNIKIPVANNKKSNK